MSHVMQGTVIAQRYRLERLLGEGGMGAVWAATHTVTGKTVAVKFLRSELASNAGVVERFMREARAACAVRHPNVVQIHDVLTLESGAPAMVMDFLEGETLGAKLVREHRLSMPEFAHIMGPVLSAVAAAHSASIVHRDLKPENLFLARVAEQGFDIKVLDFGIAKITTTEQQGGQLTKTGSMLGTPYYMSPEQLFGEKDIDGRSDIWALGIIFYECLSGILPTQADNLGQIIKQVTVTGIPPLANVAPDVPPEVSALVARMLTRERAVRPSLDEIRSVIGRHGGVVTMPSVSLSPSHAADPIAVALAPTAPGELAVAKTGDLQWSSTPASATQGGVTPARRRALVGALVGVAVLAFGTTATFGIRHFLRPSLPPPTATSAAAQAVSALPIVPSASVSAPEPSAAPSALPAAPPSQVVAPTAPPRTSVPSAKPTTSSTSPTPQKSKAPGKGLLEENVPF